MSNQMKIMKEVKIEGKKNTDGFKIAIIDYCHFFFFSDNVWLFRKL